MRKEIDKWIAECPTCQFSKHETVKSPGLLQPLPIPQHPWRDTAMDFISGLPSSKNHDTYGSYTTEAPTSYL